MEYVDIVWNFVKNNFGTITIAGLVGFIVRPYIDGFWKWHFDKLKREDRHRIDVARDVHDYCVEAEAVFYSKPLENRKGVISTFENVRALDEKAGEQFDEFVKVWEGIVLYMAEHKESVKTIENRDKMVKEARKLREPLLKWSGKIKTGKS